MKQASKKQPYPWYQVENWAGLEQGDILPNCPVILPPANLSEKLVGVNEGDELHIPTPINFGDLIIMSQSCDLAQDKITQVLLCAHFPASNFSKGDRSSIRREQRPALHMIEKCDIEGFEFERQIVDFRTIYTLPKDFVTAFADSFNQRVRLLPPYKEHLSQSFARYFMRVGLPRPLEDD
jgi:hypothetical protein